jgi:hypothetical protein
MKTSLVQATFPVGEYATEQKRAAHTGREAGPSPASSSRLFETNLVSTCSLSHKTITHARYSPHIPTPHTTLPTPINPSISLSVPFLLL